MIKYKNDFIIFMVKSGVLTFGDFTAKSGRKTPYFINTGNYKTGEQIYKLGEFYAECLNNNLSDNFDVLFGPAYKGIPLCVTISSALYNKYNFNKNYCFNRKEDKKHGEGGSIVGHKLLDGDRVIITEDVITAGTAIKECLPIINNAANVKIAGLIVSVDRMERGQSDKTAIDEINSLYGIKTFSIVNTREIIEVLYDKDIDGKIYIDDNIKCRMEDYLSRYGI